MLQLPGFVTTAEIHRSRRYVVCRGERISDGLPVVLKTTASPFPDLADLAKLKQEHELARRARSPGLIQYHDLVRHGNTYVLVLEDFGAVSLAEYLGGRPLAIEDFLRIGGELTEAVRQLHERGLIHKDIKPQNILIGPGGAPVKLIDLGVSSLLESERHHLTAVPRLEGTLTHMAPEQTGRINRAVDQRADLYSLGVCFYQLLTGQLPFASTEPLELIHKHLARAPEPPSRLRPGLPQVFDAIVLRLLAKTPEERFRSAAAVGAALAQCHLAHAGGRLDQVTVDVDEDREHFQVSQTLYGRQREVAALLEAFEAVCGGPARLFLVSGYSGIGKSALVYELHKPIVARRGNFLSGKFDQYRRNVPYASLVQAFQTLVKQILREDSAELERWRQRLAAALGSNAQLIIDVIPEVEAILGPQPEVARLAGADAQRRWAETFRAFLGALAAERPLVLFLDDLQWADAGTLALIEQFMAGGVRNVLFIGAYRDNEVHATHPMRLAVDAIRALGAAVTEVVLGPLDRHDLGRLVGDTLYRTADEVTPLVELLLSKTGGNPFFVGQLLTALHGDGQPIAPCGPGFGTYRPSSRAVSATTWST
jgi:hypothetical protein